MIFHLVQNQQMEYGKWQMALSPIASSYLPNAKRLEGAF